MKLVSYKVMTALGEFVRIGALDNDSIIDLHMAYSAYLAGSGKTDRYYEIAAALIPFDMIEFFKGGRMSMEAAEEVLEFTRQKTSNGDTIRGPKGEKVIYDPDEVTLLPPVPRPNSIRDTLSFERHLIASAKLVGKPLPEVWYERPFYYKGNPGSVITTGDRIIWPSYSELMDFELEFGVFIGKEGVNISAERANEYIAGYSIFNDISARDIPPKENIMGMGPAKSKDFDNSNVIGPCLVTPDEFDKCDHKMTARINGELWSEGYTSEMYHSFPRIVEYISESETLYPGDFIGSGTVGTGCGFEIDRWIKPGDIIELEIEGIGVLRNQIVRAGDVD